MEGRREWSGIEWKGETGVEGGGAIRFRIRSTVSLSL